MWLILIQELVELLVVEQVRSAHRPFFSHMKYHLSGNYVKTMRLCGVDTHKRLINSEMEAFILIQLVLLLIFLSNQ